MVDEKTYYSYLTPEQEYKDPYIVPQESKRNGIMSPESFEL